MKSLTASDRETLVRLAASLPKGDKTRRAILAGLLSKEAASAPNDIWRAYVVQADPIMLFGATNGWLRPGTVIAVESASPMWATVAAVTPQNRYLEGDVRTKDLREMCVSLVDAAESPSAEIPNLAVPVSRLVRALGWPKMVFFRKVNQTRIEDPVAEMGSFPGTGMEARLARQDKVAARPLHEIARDIKRDWKNVYFGAKPYLEALSSMNSVNDDYGYDPGHEIVRYFLANANGWRGDVAKAIKAELKALLR